MALKKNVLMPEYAKDFMCIGGECPHTCCKDWTIAIDKKTYNKYIICPDDELRTKLKKYVLKSSNTDLYAQMVLDPLDGKCLFLTKGGMCELQKKMGADYLSETCSIYPRITNIINSRNAELSLAPSCPEVARIALSNKEPMQFVYAEADFIKSDCISSATELEISTFYDLRSFILDIIQDRRFNFELRLILLGFFLQKATQDGFKHVAETIRQYKKMLRQPDIANQFFELPEMPDFQFSVIQKIIETKGKFKAHFKYLQFFNSTIEGLGFNENQEVAQRIENYFSALIKYEQVFQNYEHIFENYFVNMIFGEVFPLFGISRINSKYCSSARWDLYMKICMTYRFIKFHFVGLNAISDFNPQKAIEVIYLFHRAIFGHNQFLVKNMIDWLKENEFDTMAFMSILVRT